MAQSSCSRKPFFTDLLSVRQVARLKSVTESAVRLAIAEGRLPAWRIGSLWAIPTQEAAEWTPVGPGRRKQEQGEG